MLADKERLAHEEHERLRLARRIARLWSWEYRVDTNTVLWTIPEAHSDRTVQVTLERRKRSSPAPGVPVRQTADAGLGTVHRGCQSHRREVEKG
jgi:hypothetical protein